MAETAQRPFSTSSSVISPYAALEALASDTNADREHDHRNGISRQEVSTSLEAEDDEGEEDDDMPFLVRARFDFQATDASALSFNAGDLIYVYARLESGWWDGMLDGRRGWFPSNYVEDIAEEDLAQLEQDESQSIAYEELERGHARRQGGSEEDVLKIDDVLRGDWGSWGGGAGLEELAREMMEGDDEDDGRGFELEARRRRAQAEGANLGMDEFGVTGRHRVETDATIRASGPSSIRRDPQPPAHDSTSIQGEPQDAWFPSITPDGQVYYHNTHTGEDSWELPMESTGLEDEDLYGGLPTDEQYFNSLASSAGPASSAFNPPNPTDNDFRAPPKAQNDIPYPWVAKLSDDGREWFYHNRLTGQSRRDPPITKGDGSSMVDIGVGLRRLSVSSGPRPLRASVELQRQAVEEWERKISDALQAATRARDKPTMGTLMDTVNDSMREIFEAAVAGSAAEEEMSRAVDLGSETGIAAAVMREESAVEMLASAHATTLSIIRDLLRSFGYVGPLDKMEEMPRPHWVGDMTLIGSIGLLSANVHAAVVSKRTPDSGLSVWAEVMRSASKLKDVLANFPGAVLAKSHPPAEYDSAEGRRLQAWLGFEALGEPLGGKWGYGKTDLGLRVLDQAAVIACQKVREEFEATLRDVSDPSRALSLIRIAARFSRVLSEIDIASVIDVDGDIGDLGRGVRAREDDLREYDRLVDQARQALHDLDNSVRAIDSTSIKVVYQLESTDIEPVIDTLVSAVTAAFRAINTLLIISGEQAAAVEQGLIRGQIGVRSARFISQNATTRPTSMISSTSRTSTSRRSDVRRSRVRGLEEEFLDQDEYGEMRDQAGDMQPPSASASASTTSLAQQQSRVSATSSTTSLGYQPSEADSGSQKGNRTSILKAFRRNRSGSDADDGRGSSRGKPSKKLAKIFGEDLAHIPVHPSVPPPALSTSTHTEAPWYLSDDFEQGEIIFDDKGGVKGGTLKALVIRLTQHSSTDTPFFQAFLLTFRSFTNGAELFDRLVERYSISAPDGLTYIQAQEWKVKKQAPIRLRVANALRTWLERHYIEETDAVVLDKIEDFASTTLLANGSELMSKQLLTLVAKRRKGEPEQTRGITSGSLLSPPAPLVPRVTGRQLRLTDISPLEIARQLTIIEFVHFQRIKPSECLNRAWAEEGGSSLAPNVRNVILTANRMAGWVALHILSSKDVRQRATAMKILIQVAVECRNLNNFSSMAGIIAGLNSAPITRLKRTRELLSVKTQNMKADLDRTLDSSKNFANYKDLLKTINPPCVPFFGFYLSALTFIEDGNKNFIQPGAPTKGMTTSTSSSSLVSVARPSPLNPQHQSSVTSAGPPAPPGTVIPTQPLINFFKRSLNAEILRDIAQYQSQPYNLARCRSVLQWINRGLDEVDKGGDLYELSQALEPREKEEERITRMLHDSVSAKSTRIILGCVEAVFFPGAIYLLGAWYTKNELGKRIGGLYIVDGVHGIRGWRWLFIIEGVATVGIAALSAFVLPEYPYNPRILKPVERELAVWRLEKEAGAAEGNEKTGTWEGFRIGLRDPKTYTFIFCNMMSQGQGSIANFFPTIVKTMGYDSTITLLLTAPPYIFAAAFYMRMTTLNDRRNTIYPIIMGCIALSIVTYVLSMAPQNLKARYTAMMLMPCSSVGPQLLLYKAINHHMPRPLAKRAATFALTNAIGGTSNIWASYLWTDGPFYYKAFGTLIACAVVFAMTITAYRFYLILQNKLLEGTPDQVKRAMKLGVTQEQVDMGWRNDGF
ncbi:hypothetical protein IAR55_003693 [Kwoniella newhampshirensis]|uniref:Cell division control protein 25 n=1 Tax=Kwoniella newhampshirensis TaxID=1651941 RepID=A0AAW0YXC4_9TREE